MLGFFSSLIRPCGRFIHKTNLNALVLFLIAQKDLLK